MIWRGFFRISGFVHPQADMEPEEKLYRDYSPVERGSVWGTQVILRAGSKHTSSADDECCAMDLCIVTSTVARFVFGCFNGWNNLLVAAWLACDPP